VVDVEALSSELSRLLSNPKLCGQNYSLTGLRVCFLTYEHGPLTHFLVTMYKRKKAETKLAEKLLWKHIHLNLG